MHNDDFEQNYKRQAVPESDTLQSNILSLTRSLPQHAIIKEHFFKRAFKSVVNYKFPLLDLGFRGVAASVFLLVISVFLVNTFSFKQDEEHSVISAADVPDSVNVDFSANDFSFNDYAWQDVVLSEDEFWLAGF